MTDDQYNPDDLAFLVSRSMDDDLSPAERLRLADALSLSESLRAEVSKLKAVQRLVGQWGQESFDVDWKHHAALISASAASSEDESLGKVDSLLSRWANRSEVDAIDLTAGVLSRIHSERRGVNWHGTMWRLGVPLAAAAAIALAVTATTWFPSRVPVCLVTFGPSSEAAITSESVMESQVVSFARSDEPTTPFATMPVIGFATIGVEAAPSGEESAPL